MTDPDLIRLFVEPLEELGLTYMITGGVAAVVYGDPRFTRDIDLVLELDGADVGRLAKAFAGGAFYVPPEEAMEEEVGRRRGGHFNIVHRDTALRADIYLSGDDPLHAWAFDRRLRLSVEGLDIWLAPVEYVIVRKLGYFRSSGSERHLRDVAMVLRVSGDGIDEAELERWIEDLDLRTQLLEARRYPMDEP